MKLPNGSGRGWINRVSGRLCLFFSVGTRSVLIGSLLTTALLTSIKKVGLLQSLELSSFDHLVWLQPDYPPDSRLLIVGMTEADIQQYGWPLPDPTLTDLLQHIQTHHPKVVGLDLYRSTLESTKSSELTQQLSANNLIAIMNVGSDPGIGEVPPPPNVPWERVGFNDLVIDADGILRRSLLLVGSPSKPYYSFALRVALAYLTDQSPQLERDQNSLWIGGTRLRVLDEGSGGYQKLDDRGYQILLHYRSRQLPAQIVTVSQILSGQADPEWFEGKVVLIGTVAESLKDQFYTPYSTNQSTQFTMSGVVIHAQIISQLLGAASGEQVLYRFWTQWQESLWLLGWTLIAGIGFWYIKRPIFALGSGGVLILMLWGIGWLSLNHLVWLPIAEPTVGILVTGGLVILQKLLYHNTHDTLTHLPGREVFLHHIQQALSSAHSAHTAEPVIVAFLDIDRFKLINKSMGHAVGDRVLISIVNRLKQSIPSNAELARVGGDEFAILFQGISQDAVERSLSTLQQSLSEPFYLDDQRFSITASIGLAMTQPDCDHQPEDLLRDAHTAMYRAKALGKVRYEVFAEGMHIEAINRLHLESDLLQALEKQEFCLYYQPIICLQTGKIAGFEALVRWQQADRGFVLPNAFIPIAEETGLIVPLGQWVFQEACRQLKVWQQQFPDDALKLSINLSSKQFSQTDLVKQIESTLRTVGISGQHIHLEITESILMEDVQSAIALMLRLKELGLQLSIDDFGTGYSSLSYLHRFPMDLLKVDRSFVSRMEHSGEDREIVHTIIALGHKLAMRVVAEGIETSGQMAMLQQVNCQYGQGYFFSRPLSAQDATQLLSQRPTWTAMDLSEN
jgi:diguanylate cyclase (GGDEF)-like protein